MATPTRTKTVLVRVMAPVIAALIVGFAFLYSDSDWFGELKGWFEPARAPKPAAARPGPLGTPITVTPMRPMGTDSSVSPVPQPLILVRTQPGRNSREGFAQIGVNALTPQTYTAGAILANGARLSEIYPQYVVLERDGKAVRLYLKDGNAQSPPSTGVMPAGRAGENVTSILSVGGTPAPVLSEATKTRDPLTDYLRPSPAYAGGKVRGITLYPGRHRTLAFSRVGLESGDIITRIDGHPVNDPGEAIASLRSLLKGAALTAQIERQGTSRTLALDGSVLTGTPADKALPGIDPLRLRESTLHGSTDRPIDR